jgi:hypothetical protein
MHRRNQLYEISLIIKLETMVSLDKVGEVYYLEFTEIPGVFFMPHHRGYCCTDVV